MLFAILDYRQYKRREGRYSRNPDLSVMGGAFEGSLNPVLLKVLRPGDVVFVQRLDWPLAWLIMYVTRFEVSHVATYVGHGEIAHVTLAGFRVEPIEELYGPSSRLLPASWALTDQQRAEFERSMREDFRDVPYGWLPALVKGIRMITGRDWPSFQWRVFLDVAITILVLDLPFLFMTGKPVLSWLILGHLALVAFNCAKWSVFPLELSTWTGKPIDIFLMVSNRGGEFLCDAGPFVGKELRS